MQPHKVGVEVFGDYIFNFFTCFQCFLGHPAGNGQYQDMGAGGPPAEYILNPVNVNSCILVDFGMVCWSCTAHKFIHINSFRSRTCKQMCTCYKKHCNKNAQAWPLVGMCTQSMCFKVLSYLGYIHVFCIMEHSLGSVFQQIFYRLPVPPSLKSHVSTPNCCYAYYFPIILSVFFFVN